MKTYTIGQGFNSKNYAMLIYFGHAKDALQATN